MAKRQSIVESVTDTVGTTLGKIAATVDTLRAEHPHPIEEIRQAVAERTDQVANAGRALRVRATAVVKKTKKAVARNVKKSKKIAKRASSGTTKTVARARRTTKAAAARGRAVAKKTKKTAARGRAALRRR